MREFRLFVQFIEKDFLFKLILALLVYSLVPLAEVVFFIYLGNLIGSWLVLVVAALVGLPGVLIAHNQIRETLGRLRAKMRDRQYPGPEAVDFLALLVGGVFLVTPGFLTDVLGYLLFVPLVRKAVARGLARKMGGGLKDLYDYLRVRELEL
jgi:UPF0716 protein FxsA